MQGNKINSIVFLKDVESNLIEEAVIVMKGNVKLYENEKNERMINKNTILKEAELIVNNRLEENDKSFLKFKIAKLIKKNKILKITNIIMLILIVILFFA